MTFSPPLTPTAYQYTQFWCEENVYLLAQSFLQDIQLTSNWDVFAVFISNTNETVALWNQKLAKESGFPVVWDYHVILVLRSQEENPPDRPMTWVYDFDTTLSFPVSWTGMPVIHFKPLLGAIHLAPYADYFGQTFSPHVLPNFQSSFRVVPGKEYIENFASDRTHMLLTQEGEEPSPVYRQPPPPHPHIRGSSSEAKGITHNLPGFISMTPTEGHGEVYSFERVNSFFSGMAI